MTTYRESGVDTEAGLNFINSIKHLSLRTNNQKVLSNLNGFAALYEFDFKNYKNPVIVSTTDGVGTKIELCKLTNDYSEIGVDLVAMCVNDIICCGAKPLFFLNYISCGKLNQDVLTQIIKGISKGCQISNTSLIGGETAEHPGVVKDNDIDLAGFCVGIVEKENIIDGSNIQEGDIIIGLPSSGVHSNGFSLIRKVFDKYSKEIIYELLSATRIYSNILQYLNGINIKGIAHITGGSFYEKVPKIIPNGLCARIDIKNWDVPKIFNIIKAKGNITDSEMYSTFNMGIGMVFVISEKNKKKVFDILEKIGDHPYTIGEIIKDNLNKVILKNL